MKLFIHDLFDQEKGFEPLRAERNRFQRIWGSITAGISRDFGGEGRKLITQRKDETGSAYLYEHLSNFGAPYSLETYGPDGKHLTSQKLGYNHNSTVDYYAADGKTLDHTESYDSKKNLTQERFYNLNRQGRDLSIQYDWSTGEKHKASEVVKDAKSGNLLEKRKYRGSEVAEEGTYDGKHVLTYRWKKEDGTQIFQEYSEGKVIRRTDINAAGVVKEIQNFRDGKLQTEDWFRDDGTRLAHDVHDSDGKWQREYFNAAGETRVSLEDHDGKELTRKRFYRENGETVKIDEKHKNGVIQTRETYSEKNPETVIERDLFINGKHSTRFRFNERGELIEKNTANPETGTPTNGTRFSEKKGNEEWGYHKDGSPAMFATYRTAAEGGTIQTRETYFPGADSWNEARTHVLKQYDYVGDLQHERRYHSNGQLKVNLICDAGQPESRQVYDNTGELLYEARYKDGVIQESTLYKHIDPRMECVTTQYRDGVISTKIVERTDGIREEYNYKGKPPVLAFEARFQDGDNLVYSRNYQTETPEVAGQKSKETPNFFERTDGRKQTMRKQLYDGTCDILVTEVNPGYERIADYEYRLTGEATIVLQGSREELEKAKRRLEHKMPEAEAHIETREQYKGDTGHYVKGPYGWPREEVEVLVVKTSYRERGTLGADAYPKEYFTLGLYNYEESQKEQQLGSRELKEFCRQVHQHTGCNLGVEVIPDVFSYGGTHTPSVTVRMAGAEVGAGVYHEGNKTYAVMGAVVEALRQGMRQHEYTCVGHSPHPHFFTASVQASEGRQEDKAEAQKIAEALVERVQKSLTPIPLRRRSEQQEGHSLAG